jgi:hypothetical protein
MAPDAERGQTDPGFYASGEVVAQGPGRPYGEGERRRQPWVVTLLMGRSTVGVEYPDQPSAESALASAPATATPGSDRPTVLLRVFPRLAGKREFTERCFIVYGGPRGDRQ